MQSRPAVAGLLAAHEAKDSILLCHPLALDRRRVPSYTHAPLMATVSADLELGTTPPQAPPPPSGIAPRLDSIDLLRGIVLVVMSLDHLRDFMSGLPFAPEDMSHTWPALFFMRWVTHFCAPLFFFLAGTGAWLGRTRGRSPQQLSHYLWTRGLWLIFLELTVVGFGWTFTFWSYGGVIWALGACMVLLSLLIRVPVKVLAGASIVLILTHNLLDAVQPGNLGRMGWLWTLIHSPGPIPILPQRGMWFVLYVIVPWIAVMAAGYTFGAIVQMDAARRRRWMYIIGGSATALFVVIRGFNLFGAPLVPGLAWASLWQFAPQSTFPMTVVAFLNTQKYPPATQYLLMTLGPGILTLALFDRFDAARTALGRALVAFGRVPMFYYLVHLFAAHSLAIAAAMATGQPWKWLVPGGFFLRPAPGGYGHGLAFIYSVWILMNVALYFPVLWYAEYKRTHRHLWWLGYL
jgi:uncharacterized membrane protein